MRFTFQVAKRIVARMRRLKNLILDTLTLAHTGSFDRKFYEMHLSRNFRFQLLAIIHYVVIGSIKGVEPSPLFSKLWLAEHGHPVRNLGHYLRCAYACGDPSPHPLFEPLLVKAKIQGIDSKYGVLEGYLAHAKADTPLPRSTSTLEPVDLTFGELLADRTTVSSNVDPTSDLVSVIVDDVSSWTRALEVVESIFSGTSEESLELILVPSTCRIDLYQLLYALELVNPSISIFQRPTSSSRGEALNGALEQSHGDRAIFLHVGHRMSGSAIEQMADALRGTGVKVVQPLVLDRTGLISSAGAVFPDWEPVPFPWLRGISPETAEMPAKFSIPAAQFPFMVRQRDLPAGPVFNEAAGARWLDVDLSLRMAERYDGAVVMVASTPVVRVMRSPYEPLPMEPTVNSDYRDGWANLIPSTGIPGSSTTLQVEGPTNPTEATGVRLLQFSKPLENAVAATGVPRFRWSIKTAAPSSLGSGESYRWGDTYFANSLRDALVRRGQIVAVDCVENRAKETGYLDDVVLNLQGYEGIVPVAGAINITWVISHPELVVREDLQRCQLNYAASHYWAELKSREWGLDVRPLLQCTDQHLFHPSATETVPKTNVVFVGNAVNRDREIVEDAVALGIDVDIYGKGWRGRVPMGMVRAEHIDNEELCGLYRSAKATLNDHWPDMREQGFLSNRAFDVVAAGGRVISDEVHGVPEEVLAKMAIEYDLGILLGSAPTQAPSRVENPVAKLSPAEYVLEQHTFDARARTLLEDVLGCRTSYMQLDC